MSLVRGALVAGRFRTQHELNGVSNDDERNILIVEMAGRTNQSGTHFQGLNDFTLAGAAAVYIFLRDARIRTEQELKAISDDDQRNILIVELGAQTGLGSGLQGLNNIELVLLGLGKARPGDLHQGSFLRGVLLAGQFRTQHELNAISDEDQRNTLIVEMAGRTNQPVGHFQAMDDFNLAGAGAAYVFLRNARIRTEQQLKAISEDDQRNILIVEIGAQTGLGSRLQGLRNMDLVRLGLGVDQADVFKPLPGSSPPPVVSGDIATFDSGPLTSSLPLGGSLHLVIRRNGNFTLSTHAHDSGFDNIDYVITAVLIAASGIAFTFQHAGHVEGTSAGLPLGTPDRNDDFTAGGQIQ